jgi:PBP1b-binding outer membrane lipoprotein LpoB
LKVTKWVTLLILVLFFAGCASNASQSSTEQEAEYDVEKFISDTEKLKALAEEVYNSGREFTVDEEREFNYYEVNYGEDSGFEGYKDVDVRLIVSHTLMLFYDAKRLSGVEDTFSRDLSNLEQSIEDLKAKQ